MARTSVWLALAGTTMVASGCLSTVPAAAAAPPTTTCQVFPADSIWNTDISSLPVNSSSAPWLASMAAASTNLHPDFGAPPYGFPYNVVDNSHPTVSVTFQYASESDPGPYPVGTDTSIENGSDRHALIINRDTCMLYELYALSGSGSSWSAGSGAIFPLGSDSLRPSGWTSADAAGLPIFPGLVRWDEVQAGAINHAIRFTAQQTDQSFIWPARHQAGTAADSSLPPMGARFRLKSSYDISHFSAQAQVILRALQHYGLILADNGSNWFFSGTMDANWPDSLLSELKTVPASQFEAVDESGLMVDPNSAATGPPATPAAPTAVAGEASATVYWSGSAAGAVTGYTVIASPGGASVTVSGTARSAVVSGLSDGVAYTFIIKATNGAGTSPSSAASNQVVPGRGQFHAVTPARILDTRIGTGAPKQPVGPNRAIDVHVTGVGGVPATGVSAIVLNATVTDTTSASYLTVWPTGVQRPLASNLNWTAGKTVANLVEVAVGAGGSVSSYNAAGNTDIIFDIAGYVTTYSSSPGPDGQFNPVVPFRVLDTRSGNGAPQASIGGGATITVQVGGRPGSNVPAAGVSAVVLNVTATNPNMASYLTVWPAGTPMPLASNLNFTAGQTVANRVIVAVGTGPSAGQVNIYNAYCNVDVVADVGGWFTDATSTAGGSRFVGLSPVRILDTRTSHAPLGPNNATALMVAGTGGVPAMNAPVPPTAVVLNVTVTNPTAASYVTVWPDGTPRPLASDVNDLAGLTVPNLVVVKLGANGAIDLYNAAGSVDIVVDVVGWYG